MGFVSDRLYAGITRREFSDPSQPGCLWGVSKVVHTPTTAAWAALNYPGEYRTISGMAGRRFCLHHNKILAYGYVGWSACCGVTCMHTVMLAGSAGTLVRCVGSSTFRALQI